MEYAPTPREGDLLKARLAATRWALAAHVGDARRRVRELRDWRTHLREHPWLWSGLGFGAATTLGAWLAASRWVTPPGARLSQGLSADPGTVAGAAPKRGLLTTMGLALAAGIARRLSADIPQRIVPLIMQRMAARSRQQHRHNGAQRTALCPEE